MTAISENPNVAIIKRKKRFTEDELSQAFKIKNTGGIRVSESNKLVILITLLHKETGYKDEVDLEKGLIYYTGEGQEEQLVESGNKSIKDAKKNGYIIFYFTKLSDDELIFQYIVKYDNDKSNTQPNDKGIERKAITFTLKIIEYEYDNY